MQVFNIYLHGSVTAATDATSIKEGFCWPALLFGLFWALWHRMWFSAATITAACVLIMVGASVACANESMVNAVIIGAAGLSAAAVPDTALRRFIDPHPEEYTPPTPRPAY